MATTITQKGKKWELLNSLWMLWAFFGLFNFISFYYIAYRVKQRKWTIAGIIYSLPFINFIVTSDMVGPDHWYYSVMMVISLVMWAASFLHAIKVRPEYLLRLEAYQAKESRDIQNLRTSIASEYNVVPQAPKSADPISKIVQENIEPSSPQAVDLNKASEEELAAVPGIGVILAKKAISIREQIGGFKTVEHFGELMNLKPHVLERIRPLVFLSESENVTPKADQTGRIVDF